MPATAELLDDRLTEHRMEIRGHGQDMPETRDWRWPNVS
jgi:phosphoketolase